MMVARKASSVHREGTAIASGAADQQQTASSPRTPRPRGRAPRRWVLLASTGGLTTFCVFVTYQVLQSFLLSHRGGLDGAAISGASSSGLYKKTIAFEVCHGIANQRLSLLYGVLMAFELGRAAVLPDFQLTAAPSAGGGAQLGESGTVNNSTVPMHELYDVQAFTAAMAAVGVEVVDGHGHASPSRQAYHAVDISGMEDPVEQLATKYKDAEHIRVGCPLFKLQSYYFTGSNQRIMWAVLNGLQPSKPLAKQASSLVKQLRGMTHHKAYNFLHLRIETDWVEHCQRWDDIPDGRLQNNCMNNTQAIDQVLMNLNVPVTEPLFISTSWQHVDTALTAQVLKRLSSAGYQVVTAKDFAGQLWGDSVNPDLGSLLNYELALGAHKFVGNSVSTFSALALAQRRHNGLWASYYNGGNIPLGEFLPIDLLPWVFTYSSSTPQWDYMVKAAVRSALRHKTLRPFCLWSGNTSAPIHAWLLQQGVTMLLHEPTWATDLWHKAEPYMEENARLHPIYRSHEALIDSFRHMDIPIIPQLEQYIYILYTEPDVFFHKKVSLSTFGLPLPEHVGMPTDPNHPQGVDGGIMLLNTPAVREQYEEFRLFVLGNRHGSYYPGYGSGAAGAFIQFYEPYLRTFKLSDHFAAKPSLDYDVSAYMVHFQGPKPHDYLQHFQSLQCAYGDQCEAGIRRSLCPYIKKWHQMLEEGDEEVGQALWYSCLVQYAPHLRALARHKLALGA